MYDSPLCSACTLTICQSDTSDVVKYGFDEHPDLSDERAEPRQLEAQKGA